MSYIGNTAQTQAFTPAIDYFSGNASTTAFTLSRPVASVAQVQVTIDNVAQNPSSAYTVSSNTITFTSAPLSGTNNIYVYYTSPITQVIAPGQGTVTTTSMASSTGTGAGVFQTSPTITTPTIDTITSAASTALTLKSAGTTAVTIDTSQNVGIGITSPTRKLAVSGTWTNTGDYLMDSDSPQLAWTSGALRFKYGGLGGTEAMRIDSSGRLLLGTTATPSGGGVNLDIVGQGSSDSGIQITAGTGASGGGLAIISNATGGGKFYTFTGNTGSEAYTERMRIDSSGNVLVRTTTSTNFQDGISLYSASLNSQLLVGHGNGASSGNYYAAFYYNTNTIGTITQNGTTAVAYNTSSDYRLKENIAPLTGALNKVSQLKPVSYTWKASPEETGEGFIAHELAEVCPQAVTGEKDAVDADGNPVYQGIDTSFLVATLTAALQETKALIDTQAETINALTARIEALEGK